MSEERWKEQEHAEAVHETERLALDVATGPIAAGIGIVLGGPVGAAMAVGSWVVATIGGHARRSRPRNGED